MMTPIADGLLPFLILLAFCQVPLQPVGSFVLPGS